MKKYLKKIIPPFFLYFRKAWSSYYYDLVRFYKYSATTGLTSKERLAGRIIVEYHIIEKGLTMPETRLGFGKDVIEALIKNCITYLTKYDCDDEQVVHAIGVVFEYEAHHARKGFELSESVRTLIENLRQACKTPVSNREQDEAFGETYFDNAHSDFFKFSNSRRSVRNYSGKDVPAETIEAAIRLSTNAPSACNRQTVKVYVYTVKKVISQILEVQGGNRGFGHLANKLVLITADQSVFLGFGERYQAFIDGGMFAMNMLYALHYYEVAACILNCSHTPEKDKKMRAVTNINNSECFIAMISCGYPPEKFRIAASRRYPSERMSRIL